MIGTSFIFSNSVIDNHSKNKMRFHFLGTSAGSPTVERNVTSLAVAFEQRGDWYMFDCGDGTQQRILRTSLSLPKMSKIFITHMHGDHCYGLPGILTSRGMMCGSERPLKIYGPKGITEFVNTILRLSYTKVRYPIEFHEFSTAGELYSDDLETMKCVKLSHDVPSFAYVLNETDRPGVFDVEKAKKEGIPHGPLFGELSRGGEITLEDGRKFDGKDFIGESRRGRKIIINGDNESPELLSEEMKTADLMVHESTHTEEVRENLTWSSKHSTAKSVASAAEKSQLPNLILTHFSPRFAIKDIPGFTTMKVLEEEARQSYSGELFMARDYDIYHLDRKAVASMEYRKIWKKRTKPDK
jgi:ribonuclease Z